MVKENEHLRKKIPKKAFLFGNLALAAAAIASACGEKDNDLTRTKTPLATPTFDQIKTPTPTIEIQVEVAPTEKISTPTPEVLDASTLGKVAIRTDGDVWIVNGPEKVLIAENADPKDPVIWSPQGDKIAVKFPGPNITDDFWQIYDLQGNVLARIETIFDFSWMPDGNALIYSDTKDVPGDIFWSRFVHLNLETGEKMEILRSVDETFDHTPLISPNGKKLIFAHEEFGCSCYATLVNLESLTTPKTGPHVGPFGKDLSDTFAKQGYTLIDPPSLPLAGNDFLRFQWTPDSQKIVFARQNAKVVEIIDSALKSPNHIFVANIADGTTSEIDETYSVNDPIHENIDLSHDGQKIVFARLDGIHVIDMDDLSVTKIIDKHPFNNFHHARWSENDQKIIFLDLEGNIYSANADGSGFAKIKNPFGTAIKEILPAPIRI